MHVLLVLRLLLLLLIPRPDLGHFALRKILIQRVLHEVNHFPDGTEVQGLVFVGPGDAALPGVVLAVLDADDEGFLFAAVF